MDKRIKKNQARIHEIRKKAAPTALGESDSHVLSAARESVKQFRERLRAAEGEVERLRQKAKDYRKKANKTEATLRQKGDEAARQQAASETARQKQLLEAQLREAEQADDERRRRTENKRQRQADKEDHRLFMEEQQRLLDKSNARVAARQRGRASCHQSGTRFGTQLTIWYQLRHENSH